MYFALVSITSVTGGLEGRGYVYPRVAAGHGIGEGHREVGLLVALVAAEGVPLPVRDGHDLEAASGEEAAAERGPARPPLAAEALRAVGLDRDAVVLEEALRDHEPVGRERVDAPLDVAEARQRVRDLRGIPTVFRDTVRPRAFRNECSGEPSLSGRLDLRERGRAV